MDFLVIGGYAAVAHGSAQITRNLDICYSPDEANLTALGRALVALDAHVRGGAEVVPFVPDAKRLRNTQVGTLETAEGPLHLVRVPGYAALTKRALTVAVAGVTVRVASLKDLLAMKRASGRPKDLVAVEELEAIARLERDG